MVERVAGTATRSGYSTQDVARILDLPPDRVRRYARSDFLTPSRGLRNEYRFSFQDLVLMRTACELEGARVPLRRIHAALRELRDQLPEGRPLTSVRIAAEGGRVVVHDGTTLWNPSSGQVQFDFRVADIAERVAPLDRVAFGRQREELDADGWLDLAVELEASSPELAIECYLRVLEIAPRHVDAHVNVGYLLQEEGRLDLACDHYRAALEASGDCAIAAFNLGVALEDLGRSQDAVDAYSRAIAADPRLADAYYNLSRLYEAAGDRAAALRHLRSYSELIH